MKKLVVLIMVLALMAIALPVMASDVSFSGELTVGFNSDFTSTGYVATASNAYIDLAAKVDKNNTVNAEIGSDATLAPSINNFYLVSDLGGAFGMSGVDPVLTAGYGDPVTGTALDVSGYGNEDVAFTDPGFVTEVALAVAAGPANILVAFDPMLLSDQTTSRMIIGGDGTFGPITAAAYYGVAGAGFGAGSIGGGVKYSGSMGGIDLGANAQGNYALGTGGGVTYGAGVSASMKMFNAGVGFNGGLGAMEITANASLTPSDMFGADVGLGMNLASGGNAFDTLDASGWVAAGPTKIRIGYLYYPAGGIVGALNAPASSNGLYGSFDLSF